MITTIDNRVKKALRRIRVGFTTATAGGHRDDGRMDVKADYLDDAQKSLRRILPPLLDVIPEAKARLALIAQDGAPEFSAWLGVISDEANAKMSAWIRANLAKHPGHVELGATKGVTVICGGERVTITPEENTLRIQCTAPMGKIIVEAPTIELGEGATESVLKGDTLIGALNTFVNGYNLHTHAGPGAPPTALAPTGTFNLSKSNFVKVV